MARPPVDRELAPLSERLTALLAGVGLGASVDVLVLF